MNSKKPSPEKTKKQEKEPNTKIDPSDMPEEFGGTGGPEPTRYGDWENNGRCTDF